MTFLNSVTGLGGSSRSKGIARAIWTGKTVKFFSCVIPLARQTSSVGMNSSVRFFIGSNSALVSLTIKYNRPKPILQKFGTSSCGLLAARHCLPPLSECVGSLDHAQRRRSNSFVARLVTGHWLTKVQHRYHCRDRKKFEARAHPQERYEPSFSLKVAASSGCLSLPTTRLAT